MLNAIIQSTRYYKNLEAEISRSATEACDNILNALGAEIHDDLVQRFSLMRLYLERLDPASPHDPDYESNLISVRTQLDYLAQCVKDISRRLMPATAEDQSFSTSIESLCQNMDNARTANIHFSQDGFERPISHIQLGHLYRMVQELLHNAFKHSFAWHVWVHLSWQVTRLIISVEDDGTGVNNLAELTARFRQKNNTLKMRTNLLGGSIAYLKGERGLVARVEVNIIEPAAI